MQDAAIGEFSPCVRSGVWFDIGARQNMEDEHVLIDDLVDYLGPQIMKTAAGSFYGVSLVLHCPSECPIYHVFCKFLIIFPLLQSDLEKEG